MGANSHIQWTDHTFNPIIGCSKVSDGCKFCYAEADFDKRKGRVKWGVNGTRSVTSEGYWGQLYNWNKQAKLEGVRRKVFVASLSDIWEDWKGHLLGTKNAVMYKCNSLECTQGKPFYPHISWYPEHMLDDKGDCGMCGEIVTQLTAADVRRALFHMIDSYQWLDFLLLTKRPENIARMMPPLERPCRLHKVPYCGSNDCRGEIHRDNLWLGTSVEDARVRERLMELWSVAGMAKYTFVSGEPLLGAFDPKVLPAITSRFPDWLILGGESGHNARPCHIEHIQETIRLANPETRIFVKQLGAHPQNDFFPMKLKDKKGGDINEWPTHLQRQEFPNT